MTLIIPLQNAKLVKWPAGNLTQGFGENPELYKKMGMLGHNGIDIALPKGTPVLAATDGIIYEVKNDVGGYGSHIRILSNEENGITFETIYGHLGEIFVKEDDRINAGDKIAEESNTGFVISAPLEGLGYTRQFWGNAPSNMGNHLHFGLRRWQFWTTEPIPGYQVATGKKNYTILNYNNGFLGYIDPMPFFNQSNTTNMTYGIDAEKHQWLYDYVLKIAFSIADEPELNNLKKNLQLAELLKNSPVEVSLSGYTIYRGATEQRIKEFFNLK